MRDFLRNSRPLPYKTLATGILFNGVIEYHKEDVNENSTIDTGNLKDGITILYFNKGIESVAVTDNIVDAKINLLNYERAVSGVGYLFNNSNLQNIVRSLDYKTDAANYVEIIIAENSSFKQPWDITVDGKEYKDGMPVLVNKLGGLVFIDYFLEI